MRTMIGQYNRVIDTVSLVKLKSAKINPSATTHTLVYSEMCFLSFMKNNILCCFHTLLLCLIAYIYGIASCFRESRLVDNRANLTVALSCLYLSSRTCCKWILTIIITSIMLCETFIRSGRPLLLHTLFLVVGATIVIYYNFILLPISFTRCKDNCSCVLKHRNEIRKNYCLCV